MMNTFTAQELADFYQKVADGGEIDYTLMPKDCFGHPENGPHMGCSKDVWRIKPTKKVIDLSVLIESGIDCEFWHSSRYPNQNEVGKLGKFTNLNNGWFYSTLSVPYLPKANKNGQWKYCKPRMNHKHAWPEGECPLPEGFEVKVWFRSGGHTVVTTRSGNYWGINGDTMCFEVLGVADGYVMPWEQDND